MDPRDLFIKAVEPSLGVPGGELIIHCQGFQPGFRSSSRVLFGEVEAEILSASEGRIIVRLPESPNALGMNLRIDDCVSRVFQFTLARRLASGLHPVANPVIAPDGSVITTVSGARGQQVSQSLVKVTLSGEQIPFGCEIMNPTALAFDKEGQLCISSRYDGAVYRYRDYEQLEVVADDLGIACGMAFDSAGNLFVGDRSGRIIKVAPSGEKEDFASLEPSISAYHIAMDAADCLYVTGPTFSLRDPLIRINPDGRQEVVLEGLARPQGMALSPEGEILLAASWKGKKGIFIISPERGKIVHHIAGPMLVGIALFGRRIILADNTSLFLIQPGGVSADPL
jgi:hypothetical protein